MILDIVTSKGISASLAITPLLTQLDYFASYIHLQDQDFIETENNYIND